MLLDLNGIDAGTQLLADAAQSDVSSVDVVRKYFDAHVDGLSDEQLHWLLMVMCSLVAQKPVEQAL